MTAEPGLQVSPTALHQIRKGLQKGARENEQPIGIRVNVKKAGCSGYEYVLEYAYEDSQRPLDFVFSFEEVKIVIDKMIYHKFFKGGQVVMDFQKEEMKEGLIFHNPNVANQCGCGESFTLVDEQ